MTIKKEYEAEGRRADRSGDAPEVDDGALTLDNEGLDLSSERDDAVHARRERRGPVEDDLLVAALAAGWSPAQAADLAGVVEVVVLLRMGDVAFLGRVVHHRWVFGRTAEAMSSLPVHFVDAMKGELASLSGRVRLTVAWMVLAWSLRSLRGEELTVAVSEVRPFLDRGSQ